MQSQQMYETSHWNYCIWSWTSCWSHSRCMKQVIGTTEYEAEQTACSHNRCMKQVIGTTEYEPEQATCSHNRCNCGCGRKGTGLTLAVQRLQWLCPQAVKSHPIFNMAISTVNLCRIALLITNSSWKL
jgi:hypothetical protein